MPFIKICETCGRTFRVHDRNKSKFRQCRDCYVSTRYGNASRRLAAGIPSKDHKPALLVPEPRSAGRVSKVDV